MNMKNSAVVDQEVSEQGIVWPEKMAALLSHRPNMETRKEIVLYFDVKLGNPNGDFETGDPRVDPQTGHGLVKETCIKRHIRDAASIMFGHTPGYDLYVSRGSDLSQQRKAAYDALGLKEGQSESTTKSDDKKTKKTHLAADNQQKVLEELLKRYVDLRLFGGAMGMNSYKSGVVTGPIQIEIARSIDPVYVQRMVGTRCATEHTDSVKQTEKNGGITGTIADKAVVLYGLYRANITYVPHWAKRTGLTSDDFMNMLYILTRLFEQTRSSSRGMMAVRGLYMFDHESAYGNCPAWKVFESIDAKSKEEYPRKFSDYTITLPEALPNGVKLYDLA
jgi:CRISPR-associated protein Csd2